MSDDTKQSLGDLISAISLGPAWAKPGQDGKKEPRIIKTESRKGEGRSHDRDGRDGRPPRKDRFSKPRRETGPGVSVPEQVQPAPGIRVSLVPSVEAIRLIAKEIHQEARVYPLFNVANTLLAERSRCQAVFEAPDPAPFLWRGLLDESVFLTKEDALQHLWTSGLRKQLVEEETVDAEPPKGNFVSVARCGMSGEWLGPPNFHTYQVNLRRLHRERYSHIPFESYSARVRVEKGEEAVNEWLAGMTRKNRWRIIGQGEEAWTEDEMRIKRQLAETAFDEAFEEARCVEVNAGIPASHLSPSLLASMKQTGNHVRNHPAFLIPSICKVLDAEHLPVFKRQGKLYTGPARPSPVAPDQVFAERPGIIVSWIRENTPAKLDGLWKAVSPEGNGTPPASFAADLYWLLQQGHILLFPDDTLVVQELRTPAAPNPENKTKKKKKKRKLQNSGPLVGANAEPKPPTIDPPANADYAIDSVPAPSHTEPAMPSAESEPATPAVTEAADPTPSVEPEGEPPMA